MSDAKQLIDFVFHRQTVTIPPGASIDVMSGHARVASHDVLDRAGEDVSVVREAGGEGRAVVERVLRVATFETQSVLGGEGRLVGPFGADVLFGLGEVERRWKVGHYFVLTPASVVDFNDLKK